VEAPTEPSTKKAADVEPNAEQSPVGKANSKNKRLLLTPWRKTLAVTLGLVLLINAGAALWLYDRFIVQKQQLSLQLLTRAQAQQQVTAITVYLQQLAKDVQRFTHRAAFAQALQTHNNTLLQTFQQDIERAFEDFIGLRLIPHNTAVLDREHPTMPIRFAELDMIHRAENQQTVFPEAARIGKQWRLHLVAPLPTASAEEKPPVVGVMLLGLQARSLGKVLLQSDKTLGQTQLLQRFANSPPQVLAAVGEGQAGPALELEIPDSHWKIRFTPSQHLVQQSRQNPLMLIGILALTLLVSLVFAYWLAQLLHQRFQTAAAVRPIARPSGVSHTSPAESESKLGEMANPMYHDQDILDVDLHEEDQNILGLEDSPRRTAAFPPEKPVPTTEAVQVIFRDYDIRGIVGEQLTYTLAEQIGQALGSEVLDQGESHIIVARDGRLHSPEMTQRLVDGILRSGCNVINIGVVPTPLMNYATHELEGTSSGVMVTASHNPPEYNGFKMVIGGRTLAGSQIQALRSRIMRGHLHQGSGTEEHQTIIPDYIDRIFSDVALAGELHVVVDAANGVTGEVAPLLFEELGCEVTPLYCEIDGSFPNHGPDPTIAANLQDLIAKVRETGADLGVAFDGDGDRLTVVTPQGQIIMPDRLLMLFAKDIITRNPGADVLFDVKCTRQLNGLISSYGGRPVMWKSGHSHMKAKMVETGALLGGEFSGHIFIKDRWYGFDDGLYAAARLLEIMTLRDQDLDAIFSAFPPLYVTPELKIPVGEEHKFELMKQLVATGNFQNGKLTTIDGLRADYAKGWGLVRASNTSPALTLRFEGDSEDTVKQLQALFKRELLKVDPKLNIGF